MLTTTGARTGLPRTLPVLGLADGEAVILIASNFGRPQNPSWYHNLRANPRATVVADGIARELVARELSGEERDRGYRRGEEIFPGFTHYERWAANREIPVLRLEPPSVTQSATVTFVSQADESDGISRAESIPRTDRLSPSHVPSAPGSA